MPSDPHDTIAKLRAKAASTTFPHEAQALSAKADELAAQYGERREPTPTFDEIERLRDLLDRDADLLDEMEAELWRVRQQTSVFSWGNPTVTRTETATGTTFSFVFDIG